MPAYVSGEYDCNCHHACRGWKCGTFCSKCQNWANYLLSNTNSQSTKVPADGETVKCQGDGRLFRYNLERNMIMSYQNNDVIKNSWGGGGNDGEYNCGSYLNNTFNMTARPNDGATIKCSDGVYQYNRNENRLYKFQDQAIVNQYAGSVPGEVDCRQFKNDRGTFSNFNQTIPGNTANGQAIKCSRDLNTVYRYADGKIYQYETTNTASNWDGNWPNSYKVYNCGDTQNSGTLVYKPSNGQTVLCNDDSQYYRYQDNNLYKYENSLIAAQYGGALPTFRMECRAFNNPRGNFTSYAALAGSSNSDGQPINCNEATGGIYRWINGKLIGYPNQEIAYSWDVNYGNYKRYTCGNLAGLGSMSGKPSEGALIKCLNDSNFYRYNEAENKLYKYPNEAIATQYTPSPTIIQAAELDITSGRQNFAVMPNYDETRLPSYTFYFECCIQQTAPSWRNLLNNAGQEVWPPNTTCRRPAVFITGNDASPANRIHIVHSSDLDSNANIISNFVATPGVWFSCCFVVNRNYMITYFNNNKDLGINGKGSFNWGDKIKNGWGWNTSNSISASTGFVKVRNVKYWPYALALDFPSTFTIPTGLAYSTVNPDQFNSSKPDFTSYSSIPSNLTNGQAIKCSNDSSSIYRYVDGNIYKYESDAVATQWDPTWNTTYKTYNCGSKTSSGLIKAKPSNNVTIKCGNLYHRYSQPDDKLLSYENSTVAVQYGGTLPTQDTVCEPFNKGVFNTFTEFSSQGNDNGQAIKCANKNTINRWTNGKLYPYPSAQVGQTWDPNYNIAYKEYNCTNQSIISDTPMVAKPGDNDIIRCNNRNDKKTYTKTNGNPSLIAIDSSSNYFKLNKTSNKYERYGNTDDVLKSYEPNYATVAKSVDDCYMLDNPYEDSTILYPNPPDKKIIKCSNQSQGFPYYLYDSQKLRPFTVPDVAKRYDESYVSNAATYNCSYINTTIGSQVMYSIPPGGTVINCSNEPSATYPKYNFSSTTNKLNKYPTEAVYKSWGFPNEGSNYDCSYLPVLKDSTPMGYKKPANNSNVNCSNKTESSFPYYRYDSSDNSLSQYKDLTALFTYAPWNADVDKNKTMNMSTYDCNYLSTKFGSIIENKPVIDNTNIYCSNESATPPQLYRYSNSVIRPFTSDQVTAWNVSVQNVANCNTFTKGPQMYGKNFEDAFSFTLNPFLEINRNDTVTYFELDNTNDKCNPIPQNYTLLNNNSDYDKYYSVDKFVELYKDDACTNRSTNDATVKYNVSKGFNIGTLNKTDVQDSLYYKLTTTKRNE